MSTVNRMSDTAGKVKVNILILHFDFAECRVSEHLKVDGEGQTLTDKKVLITDADVNSSNFTWKQTGIQWRDE